MVSCKISVNSLIVLLLLNAAFIFGSCEENNGLLQKYKMENFTKCNQEGGLWCSYNFKISAKDPSSRIWQEIEERNRDLYNLDPSHLHRMICMPKNQQDRSSYINKLVEKELYGKDFTVDIVKYECDKNLADPFFNVSFGLLITSYIAFVVQATWRHYKHLNDPEWPKTSYQKWCDIFSIIKNYQNLTRSNTNADFQRLRAIQGLRVLTTIVVVVYHSIMSICQIYVDDVDQVEKIFKNPIVLYIDAFGVFAVQTFFVISTILLTNQILEVHRKHGKFTLKHCFILVLNRYFRFAPTLLILTTLPRLGVFKAAPHLIRPGNTGVQSCTQYAWYTLFHVSYLIPSFRDICLPTLWYLSLDTLYYITTVAVLYIALKFHLDITKVATVMFLGFCLAFGNSLRKLTQDNLWFRLYPRFLEAGDEDNIDITTKIYITPLASWSTTFIGIFSGYIYFRYKNRTDIKISSKLHTLWLLSFIGFPLLIHTTRKSFEGVTKIILAATIKPMFVMILCLAILGMAFGLGGALNTFLGSNFMAVLSNTTYCIYLFHIIITFSKGAFTTGLFHFELYHLIPWTIFDLVTSFAVGTACTILFEYPGLTLQKKYLPQIKRPDKTEVKENEKKRD